MSTDPFIRASLRPRSAGLQRRVSSFRAPSPLRAAFAPGLLAALLLLWPAPARSQLAAGGPKITCRWGKPSQMESIPGCGVPRQVVVGLPPGADRMMFAREDNPTLTRYLFWGKAIGAQPKSFKRMVNVARTDLVLCPADFQKPRILAFRVVEDKLLKSRPTCELGPPGKKKPEAGDQAGMGAPAKGDGNGAGMGAGAGKGPSAGGMAAAMGPRTVTSAIEGENPVSQADLIKMRRALKMDSLARLLGLLGLIFGVGAGAGVVVLAFTLRRRVQRLERERDRARPDDA